MITVLARLRVDNWERFKAVHDAPGHLELRRDLGNRSHHVFSQLDDISDVVFLDTWNMPQDSDSYYHSDDFQRHLVDMTATLVELIKLEHAGVAHIADGPPVDEPS
jgi:hypothetical protein